MRIINVGEYSNWPVYKNILVRYRNTILSISCHIRKNKLSNNYNVIYRFYKIKTFTNNISLEEIYYFTKKKYNYDIFKKIIKYYLLDDVSFKSITKPNDINTIKIETEIIFSEKLKSYQVLNKNNDNQLANNFKKITSIFSNNFKNLLNKQKTFNIDDIFYLNDCFDFCSIFEIYNASQLSSTSNKAWGISLKNNI